MSISFNTLRPFLSRQLASAIGALAAYLLLKYKLEVGAEEQAALLALALWLLNAVYSFFHKLFDKKMNPADVAKAPTEIGMQNHLASRKAPALRVAGYQLPDEREIAPSDKLSERGSHE